MMDALGLGGSGDDALVSIPDSPAPPREPAAPQTPPFPVPSAAGGGLPDMSVLLKLAPLLGGLNKEDENTALLKALRPYLHGDREKRLDDAIQIMRLRKVLPRIQEKGLF